MTTDGTIILAADHSARHWTSTESGRLMLSPSVHRRVACRTFHVIFNPYKPAVIDWLTLDPPARVRLIASPIWDIAVQTEGKARPHMAAYARSLDDAEVADAIALNAWEEGRHMKMPFCLVGAYDIPLAPNLSTEHHATPSGPTW
jgi:hypothetical protein